MRRWTASPPALPILSTTAWPRASSKSVTITFAPSRASVAALELRDQRWYMLATA
jgi:hypothetical protein